MKEWALLADGNPEEFAEEPDCLVIYMGKMVELQLKRKNQFSAASNMAEVNAAFSRIKHAPLQHAEDCMHDQCNLMQRIG